MPFAMVLGISQDAGVPQAGCRRRCCREARRDPKRRRYAACLAIADPARRRRWLVDVTPDYREQLASLDAAAPGTDVDGIFLTHGHVGHYAGLIHLGREAQGTRAVRLHALPRMRAFLRRNAPWEQLVTLGNVRLAPLSFRRPVQLAPGLRVTPLPVPHRSEYTETAGFRIEGARRSILWVPDTDGWDRWSPSIEEEIGRVDVAFLDATFWSRDELAGRDIREVPHPLLAGTVRRLAGLPARERAKVRFIHLNHTNPALRRDSKERRRIEAAGMQVAREGDRFAL